MLRQIIVSSALFALAASPAPAQSAEMAAKNDNAVKQGKQVTLKPTITPKPAQTPAPATTPAVPPARPRGQSINLKIELVITDQRGSAAPVRKTVSVIVGDQSSGMIRSESEIREVGHVQLHVDAEPRIMDDGKIWLRFGLQYDLPTPDDPARVTQSSSSKTQIRENLSLILENGKSVPVTQSADPVTDRQVSVEVKATILR